MILRVLLHACLALAAAAISPAQLLVAHRGASGAAPENTLAAFRLAWEEGADAIEGDFHLTSDGRIVCLHDKAFAARLRGAGLAFHCWTINDPAVARVFRDLGVDSITTDFPASLRREPDRDTARPRLAPEPGRR